MKEKRFSDLVIGVVFMALGLTVFLMANQLQTVKLGIGPAGFPKFIAVLLALLGAVMTVSALRHGVPKPQFKLEKKPTMLFLAAVALCVLYVILVPTVDFMLLTPFLMFGMMLLFGNRNYVMCAIVSVVTTVLVWLLFTKVFMIFLPTCRLFM